MWKIIMPILAGLSLLFTLPVRGAEPAMLRLPRGPIFDPPFPQESFEKIILVDIQGTLRYVAHPRDPVWTMGGYSTWQITVGGTSYQLSVDTTQLAALTEKFAGKRVRVKGRLQVHTDVVGRRGPGPRFMDARLVIRHMVEVASLEAVADQSLKETLTVVIHGKLQMNAGLGYPGRPAAVIRANGQTFVLHFGNKTLADQAYLLDGKTVVLQGVFTGFESFSVMCVPGADRLPVLAVAAVQPGQGNSITRTVTLMLKGKLAPTHDRFQGPFDQDEPVCRITVNGVTYGLDIGNPVLARLADRLAGHSVVVTGKLEFRRTFAGQLWHMIVVTGLQADPTEYVRQTETAEIHGKLVFVGIPESMFHRGIDCLVAVNGQGYWLSFAGNKKLLEQARKWQNLMVVVTGTLEHRGPVDVLMVNGLSLQSFPVQMEMARGRAAVSPAGA